MDIQHTSVLLKETVTALNLRPGRLYLDGTLGGGGHAHYLCQFLDRSNLLVGVDQDPVALGRAEQVLADCQAPTKLIHGNFGSLASLLIANSIPPRIDGGLMLDLGVSDFQIKTRERGFSFQLDAPLDMRMDPGLTLTAKDLVNQLPAQELADILYRYADEKLSRQIAAAIVKSRPIESTRQLAQLVESIYRQKRIQQQIHPATRTFQALRMAVNQETVVLESLLQQLPTLLLPGARVAIITFHSTEDRLVKQAFRLASATCICPPRQPICTCGYQPTLRVIGKTIRPSQEEIKRNPQSRSAKLRVAERL